MRTGQRSQGTKGGTLIRDLKGFLGAYLGLVAYIHIYIYIGIIQGNKIKYPSKIVSLFLVNRLMTGVASVSLTHASVSIAFKAQIC